MRIKDNRNATNAEAASDPSRDEIAKAAEAIRAGWSARRRRTRHAMAEFQVQYRLTRLAAGSRR